MDECLATLTGCRRRNEEEVVVGDNVLSSIGPGERKESFFLDVKL